MGFFCGLSAIISLMKIKLYFFTTLLFAIALFSPIQTRAVYDPLSVPNNKIGIHILFLDEINQAKDLVNSNGGDWGYVTVPIQAGDKDIIKWQYFMDEAKKNHIIPILRIATEGDYFKTTTWRKPEDTDIVDFANFLNSLEWPVKNRYVIIFNEVNRGDEWEGIANPPEYARLLSYATIVFKSKNPDFFIISAGLDNASVTSGATYNQFDFLNLMNQEVPGIFNQIDGISSHSYPNPAFSQPPTVLTSKSISSFLYELEEISKYTNKKLPVFITETGWSQEVYSDLIIAGYFNNALNGVWNNPQIVAVTPFLLKAGAGPFEKFSFIKNDTEKSEIFKAIETFSKIKGDPVLYPTKKILGTSEISQELQVRNFSEENDNSKEKNMKNIVKWLFLGI